MFQRVTSFLFYVNFREILYFIRICAVSDRKNFCKKLKRFCLVMCDAFWLFEVLSVTCCLVEIIKHLRHPDPLRLCSECVELKFFFVEKY